jgi:hypothetical protein
MSFSIKKVTAPWLCEGNEANNITINLYSWKKFKKLQQNFYLSFWNEASFITKVLDIQSIKIRTDILNVVRFRKIL